MRIGNNRSLFFVKIVFNTVVVLLSIALNAELLAQTAEVSDSYSNDSTKIRKLIDSATKLASVSPNTADSLRELALEISKQTNNRKGLIRSYMAIGNAENLKSNYSKSVEHYLAAIEQIKITNDENYVHDLGIAYCNISSPFARLMNDEKVFSYLNQARCLPDIQKHDDVMYLIYHKLGMYYMYDQPDSTEWFLEREIILAEKMGNLDYLLSSYSLYAFILNRKQDNDKSIAVCNKMILIADSLNDFEALGSTYNNLASLYKNQGKYNLALKYYAISNKMLEGLDIKLLQAYNLRGIAESQFKLKQYRKSYLNLESYDSLKGIIFEKNKTQIAFDLETKYEVEKKEQALTIANQKVNLMTSKNKFKNLLIIFFCVGLLILAIGTYLIIKNIKLKNSNAEHKLKSKILALNKKLSLLESEKNNKSNSFINPHLTSLSTREKEVLEELSLGKSNKEIANSLFISLNTVKKHLIAIYEKLEVSNRIQTAKKAGFMKGNQA